MSRGCGVAGLDPRGEGRRQSRAPPPLGLTLPPRGRLSGPGAGGTQRGQAKRGLRYWRPGSCPPHLDTPANHASGRAARGAPREALTKEDNDNREEGDDNDNYSAG